MFLATALLGAAACSTSSSRPVQPADAATASDSAPDLPVNGGTGGATVGTGGITSTGGTIGAGGRMGTGGTIGAGGRAGTGGNTGTGGGGNTGGSTGGSTGAGVAGRTGTGGSAATGGRSGTGGATAPDGSAGTGGTTVADGSPPAGSWWKPVAGLSWQWQIGGGTIDPTLAVDVFDIDWEEDASVVSQLHQASKKVICYVSVGSWEDWRPDASAFPAAVLGKDYPGWPGEKFVDIRAQALRDIMAKRLDVCKAKAFDAVEPDNMDVFSADSGFPLTQADGVDYAKWLATECHARGMGIVQKNASEITTSIQSVYDGALTEDCYKDNWCADMQPYIDANKPVFACEYTSSIFTAACTWGKPKKYSFILKSLDLNAPVTFCP
jgi:hypothetical protein